MGHDRINILCREYQLILKIIWTHNMLIRLSFARDSLLISKREINHDVFAL